VPDYPNVIIPVDKQPSATTDNEIPVSPKHVLIALERVKKEANGIARKIADVTKPVDEYSTGQEWNETQSVTSVIVNPQFDKSSERIECVIVTGPASTAFTLSLGDRTWNVLTDARGLFSINGCGILLDKNDNRKLTATTAGNWTLELTGYADERYFTP
jgi:hypothetical protein